MSEKTKKIYVETYGCQMNVADTEVVLSVMDGIGYKLTQQADQADIIFVNTCSVRDNAEARVKQRVSELKNHKRNNPEVLIGILGCMAERLRTELIDKNNVVHLVVGPDEYRKLPKLIEDAQAGLRGIAVKLSRVENYDDITPLRTEGISAWLSVMRGCDKFCTFCVVPFTRGRERSRSLNSVVEEVRNLSNQGFKEVTLLGQNVNSYHDGKYDFADLLKSVAEVDSTIRIRYMTSHPQDMSDKLIETIATHKNICKYVHLPVQSGSNRILKLMNRTYTIEHYLDLMGKIKRAIPEASFSTDFIAGFPTETNEDHQMTLDIMKEVRYDGAFMFKYSPRENTKAWDMGDDVPEQLKVERLSEIIEIQSVISQEINQSIVGREVEVLIERDSSRSADDLLGRTDTNKKTLFPREDAIVGQYRKVRIERTNAQTLFGKLVPIAQNVN
ncbi:MAG TPA: tRNA (N6-isopentenyl adenosine(37)-C2)-methylthiotransferase MiaB [Bacteroidetes bacterium]|nr:tRNA (N6-isopentenyl adenosine(37)-C2)-methylthiotransferase MiaB [Bacteroidota bacterium]